MNLSFSLLAGVTSGVGLLVSGMANPARMIDFLDITRVWDPLLAFAMGGAISAGFFVFRLVKRRTHSLCGGAINLPASKQVDKRLIGGVILFGIGQELAGIYPDLGLVLSGAGVSKGIVFVGAVVAGMLLFEQSERKRAKRQAL